ncbi:MAG: PEP-CTERM sorting domain-containing protein [Thermoguttaceae bacterium]|jgi:T5SS/PEP-CTERM-associated repeat protein|nr:PEP-CTERM sorting domain-containing protein [Thermoguttaceae bacterium]
MTSRRILPLVVLLAGVAAVPAPAAQRVWSIPGTGNWTTPANWSGEAVPGNDDWADIGQGAGNGGTAVINTTVSDIVHFRLGYGTGETGSLEILTGGSLKTTGSDYHYVGRLGSGYLTVAGGTLDVSAGHLFVGFSNPNGYGKVVQTGGSVTVAQDVYLSEGSTTTGVYELSGGDVSASRFLVGLRGIGQMDHTGGTLTVTSPRQDLTVGWYVDGHGTYNLSGPASQIIVQGASGLLRVGNSGTGVFNQSDGSVSVEDRLEVGGGATSDGTYNLSGGTISARRINVGASGTGLFRQTGGTVSLAGGTNSHVTIGVSTGSSGTYELGGPASQLNVDYDLIVGASGTGAFRQTAGQVATNRVLLGSGSSGIGTYEFGGPASQLNVNNDLIVGASGTGAFHQTAGQVAANRVLLGDLGTGHGTYELDGGTLAATSMTIGVSGTGVYRQTGGAVNLATFAYLGNNTTGSGAAELHGGSLTTNDFWLGYRGHGLLEQDGGTLAVANDFYMSVNAGSTSEYYLDSGDVSARRILVGLWGDGTFVQTGGNVSVRTGSSPNLTVAYYRTGTGVYEIRGGTVSATRINNGLEQYNENHGGPGRMRIIGSAATIEASSYYQNPLSTLEMHVGNGGVSPVQVSGTATLIAGAQLDVRLAGGAALLTGTTFDLLTANNISGTFTLADPEPLWDITQSGTAVRATLAGPGLGPVVADYDGFVELVVDSGAGAVADYVTVSGIDPGRTFWALLDVQKDGAALAGTALDDLAEYIGSAGHTVYTTHPILDSGCGVTNQYNLMFDLDTLAGTSYFAWDFSDFDPALRVAHIALGVPEPGTLLLAGLAVLYHLAGGRPLRRSRRRA